MHRKIIKIETAAGPANQNPSSSLARVLGTIVASLYLHELVFIYLKYIFVDDNVA